MARILLTGAAGFVGRNLLSATGADDHEWIALDRGFPAPGNATEHVTESVVSDLSDPRVLGELLERLRPDAVIHLAGWTGKGDSAENRAILLQANLVSTWNLLDALEAARAAGAPTARFVLASSALVYGTQPGPFQERMPAIPPDAYALTKWLAEEAVRAYARKEVVSPTILRPAVIYGPRQSGGMFVPSLARALANGERFPMTGGAQKRDLVHVKDVTRAILAVVAVGADGTFNVGSGVGVTMEEIGLKLARLAGRPDLLGVGDLPYRENEVWDYAVDATALRDATGWTPRVVLDDGLKETLEMETKP